MDWLILVVIIVNTVLSVGIFRSRRAQNNKLYVAFVTCLSLWVVSNFLENEPRLVGLNNLHIFLKLDFVFALLITYAWFRFCGVFTKNALEEKRYIWFQVLVGTLVGALCIFSVWGPWILHSPSFQGTVLGFKSGPLWAVYAITLILLVVVGLLYLITRAIGARRAGNHQEEHQLILILTGFFITAAIAILINFLQAYYPISLQISRIGLYGMVFVSSFTAYAIMKFRLFDLRLIIARAVTFSFVIALVAALYSGVWFAIATTFFNSAPGPNSAILSAVLAAIVALTFQPLYQFIAKITDRVFFQGEYNPAELIARLTKMMAETIDLDELAQELLSNLMAELRITKAAFLLVENHAVLDIKGLGYQGYHLNSKILEGLFHDLPRGTILDAGDMPEGELRNSLRAMDIALVIPIRAKEEEVAILILGRKLSGEAYNSKDIGMLDVFSSEAGIAIQNAKAYANIKAFNLELEKRVDQRTEELKNAQERELQKARDVAKLKDEFVFIAAHELKTPVAATQGYISLIQDEKITGGALPAQAKEFFTQIVKANKRLVQLVEDLLQVARSEAGRLNIQVSPVDVREPVRSILTELKTLADEKKIILIYNPPANLPLVMADNDRLKEVMVNLIGNAIKYTISAGTVTVTHEVAGDCLVTHTQDTGLGISEEACQKLFQKFYRVRTPETDGISGTGLGLFIVKQIIEKMGGSVGVKSQPGQGSDFFFALPLVSTTPRPSNSYIPIPPPTIQG